MKTMQWLLLLPVFFLLSCRSGLRLFNKGQYDKSVRAFAKQLKRSPRNEKAHLMLPIAYDSARAVHIGQVRKYRNSTDPSRYDKMRNELLALQEDYTIIYRFRAAAAVVTPKDYSKVIRLVSQKAAEMHYHLGDSLLNTGSKDDARKAWSEFDQTLAMINDYKDAARLRDTAMARGRVTITLQKGASPDCCPGASDKLVDQLRELLQFAPNRSRFVAFTTDNSPSDAHVQIDFSLNWDAPQKEDVHEDRSTDVQVIDGKDTSYVTAKGTVLYNIISVAAHGIVRYTLTGAGGDAQNSFTTTSQWERRYGLVVWGDERVLTKRETYILKSDAPPLPDEEALFAQTDWNSPINDVFGDLLGKYALDTFGYGH